MNALYFICWYDSTGDSDSGHIDPLPYEQAIDKARELHEQHPELTYFLQAAKSSAQENK